MMPSSANADVAEILEGIQNKFNSALNTSRTAVILTNGYTGFLTKLFQENKK